MLLRKPPDIPSQATPLPPFPSSTPPDSKCKDSDQPLDAGTDHAGLPQAWPHTRRLLNPLSGCPASLPPTPPPCLPPHLFPSLAPTLHPPGPPLTPPPRPRCLPSLPWICLTPVQLPQCTEPALAVPPGAFFRTGTTFYLVHCYISAVSRVPGTLEATRKHLNN